MIRIECNQGGERSEIIAPPAICPECGDNTYVFVDDGHRIPCASCDRTSNISFVNSARRQIHELFVRELQRCVVLKVLPILHVLRAENLLVD